VCDGSGRVDRTCPECAGAGGFVVDDDGRRPTEEQPLDEPSTSPEPGSLEWDIALAVLHAPGADRLTVGQCRQLARRATMAAERHLPPTNLRPVYPEDVGQRLSDQPTVPLYWVADDEPSGAGRAKAMLDQAMRDAAPQPRPGGFRP
jgi:hypothetical protein